MIYLVNVCKHCDFPSLCNKITRGYLHWKKLGLQPHGTIVTLTINPSQPSYLQQLRNINQLYINHKSTTNPNFCWFNFLFVGKIYLWAPFQKLKSEAALKLARTQSNNATPLRWWRRSSQSAPLLSHVEVHQRLRCGDFPWWFNGIWPLELVM